MRKLALGSPRDNKDIGWAIQSLLKIDRASREDVEHVFDGITITGAYTETRTLNVSTATLADVVALVATLVNDIQKRGERNTGA